MKKLRKYLSRLLWKDWQIIIITGENGALWFGIIDPKKEIIDASKKPITTISKFDYFSK